MDETKFITRKIGHRLHRARKEAGLTQITLGKAMGVTFQQVQKYERGANRVSAARLYLAARALGVPITYFYDFANQEGNLRE